MGYYTAKNECCMIPFIYSLNELELISDIRSKDRDESWGKQIVLE